MRNREQEIGAEINALRQEAELIRSRRTWKCPCCEKRTQLSKLTLIQDHYYVAPYSCNGGAYWTTSKAVFIPCSTCDTVSRICDTFVQVRSRNIHIDDDKMYKFVTGHRSYFNERLDYYGKSSPNYNEVEELRKEHNRRH